MAEYLQKFGIYTPGLIFGSMVNAMHLGGKALWFLNVC